MANFSGLDHLVVIFYYVNWLNISLRGTLLLRKWTRNSTAHDQKMLEEKEDFLCLTA